MASIVLRIKSRFYKVLYYLACPAASIAMLLHVLSQPANQFAVPTLELLGLSVHGSHCLAYFFDFPSSSSRFKLRYYFLP